MPFFLQFISSGASLLKNLNMYHMLHVITIVVQCENVDAIVSSIIIIKNYYRMFPECDDL